MVDAERIKELEKLDKRLIMKRRLTVVFFIFISFALILYAISLERKIDKLTEESPVIVVTDASTEDVYESTVENISGTDYRESDIVADGYDIDDNIHTSDKNKVYYVTASGKKYHNAGCSYLTKSRREITLSEIRSGGYSPCSRCIEGT